MNTHPILTRSSGDQFRIYSNDIIRSWTHSVKFHKKGGFDIENVLSEWKKSAKRMKSENLILKNIWSPTKIKIKHPGTQHVSTNLGHK